MLTAKTDNPRFYAFLMRLGAFSGCHQRPDRSLFIGGYQFPLCARCTGAMLGQCIGLFCFWVYIPNVSVLLAFCAVMLLDWLLQRVNIVESSNLRRVITGLLCGYAMVTLHMALLCYVAALFRFSFAESYLETVVKALF